MGSAPRRCVNAARDGAADGDVTAMHLMAPSGLVKAVVTGEARDADMGRGRATARAPDAAEILERVTSCAFKPITAVVGEWTAVAEGAVVKQRQEIPAGSIVVGTPARVLAKKVDEVYKAQWREFKKIYVDLAARYQTGLT